MEIVTHNATSLAWMGDALMTLRVRKHLLDKGYQKADILQKKSARLCSAKGQAVILDRLMQENFFTEEEKQIYKRGRNAKSYTKAKNASTIDYRRATGFEAVMGYLYLKGDYKRMIDLIRAGLGEV